MQKELSPFGMRVLVQMVDAPRIERRRTSLHSVDDVSLRQQEFGEIRAILTGNACDESDFRHGYLYLPELRYSLHRNNNIFGRTVWLIASPQRSQIILDPVAEVKCPA